jgi:hypothetical protein
MAYLLRQARRVHPAEEISRLDQYLVSLKRALRKHDMPRSVQDFLRNGRNGGLRSYDALAAATLAGGPGRVAKLALGKGFEPIFIRPVQWQFN